MDSKKQILVNSVIGFLQEELSSSSLSEEKKESIEVAIQCLETAFEVEPEKNVKKVDLLSFITVKPKIEVTDEQKVQAEEHKTLGNNYMKESKYALAIDEYTKALQLNPINAVYYCNRAAAFTRLEKDYEAINDCNEAIKIDPTYGKAYGRLGIAYSNLNKYDLALKAYQTALKYDPDNTMYETNLKVAQERLQTEGLPSPLDARNLPNMSQILSNPDELINVFTHALNDPRFSSMLSGIMSGSLSGESNAADILMQIGQTFSQRATNQDAQFLERILRNMPGGVPTETTTDNSNKEPSNKPPPDNKDQGSA